jgi:uncharacterized protein (TIGR02145 family)
MRTIIMYFFLIIGFIGNIHGQTSISLTFTATLNGNHQPLDSILIENLSQGGDTTLYGNDTVLTLYQNIGISDFLNKPAEGLHLYPSYPNPFNETTMIRFYLAQQDQVTIRIFDLFGRQIVKYSERLQSGNHQIAFHACNESNYFLSVETFHHRQVQQLTSIGSQRPSCILEYIGFQTDGSSYKKSKGLLPWSLGDNLRFIGYTSFGIDTVVAQPVQSGIFTFQYTYLQCPPTVTDYDNNIYNTVLIGNQCWMKENLRARSYQNGTLIPIITNSVTWTTLNTGGRCWYNNDSTSYAMVFGSLYNWHAIVNSNGLCPAGWHVPTDLEWQTMEMYLGMSASQASSTDWRGTDEGGKLKMTGFLFWNSPNTGATNSSGFTALPGGGRSYSDGFYYSYGNSSGWWTSSSYSTTQSWERDLGHDRATINRRYINYKTGSYVRCLKD